MQRTVRLPLQPTAEEAAALTETARLFTGAFNLVAARGWAERCKNGVALHHATYRHELRPKGRSLRVPGRNG